MVDELTGLEVPAEIAAESLEAQNLAAAKLSAQAAAYAAVKDVPAPTALIPFDEFERRIRVLRENGVRVYQDNVMKIQIDTFKRQPDPVPLAHEMQST